MSIVRRAEELSSDQEDQVGSGIDRLVDLLTRRPDQGTTMSVPLERGIEGASKRASKALDR